MEWTDDLVERMIKLLSNGLSTRQVAAELGPGITRSAVIGKFNRMRKEALPVINKPQRPSQNTRTPAPLFVREYPLELEERFFCISTDHVSLVDLCAEHCRWPFGAKGEEIVFCGDRRENDHNPYCLYHAKIAYVQHKDRKRRRKYI